MDQLLIWRIVSTIVEEAVLAGVVLWGLPQMGITVSPWVLATAMVLLAVYGAVTYRKSSRSQRAPLVTGLSSLVGARGKAIDALTPGGTVRIGGETWAAESASGDIAPGGRVVVVGQNGLQLVVRSEDVPMTHQAPPA